MTNKFINVYHNQVGMTFNHDTTEHETKREAIEFASDESGYLFTEEFSGEAKVAEYDFDTDGDFERYKKESVDFEEEYKAASEDYLEAV